MNTLRRFPLWLLILLGFVVLGAAGHAEPIKVAFYEGGHPPFMFPESAVDQGIYRDLFGALADRTGLVFEIGYYPFPRAQLLFDQGKLHLEPGINPAWRSSAEVPGLYSIPFASSVDVLLFRAGKRRTVEKPEDLEGATVGTIRGYRYPFFTDAFASGLIVRDDATQEKAVLDKLLRGRFDQAVISEAIARWWQKRDSAARTLEIGDVVGEAEICLRLHPSQEDALVKIDAALRQMLDSGEIAAIYERYR